MRGRRPLLTLSLALLLAMLPGRAAAAAPVLEMAAYQDGAGALSVSLGGDVVDPYFALRALLTASDAGLDIAPVAGPWITWLLARQHADGTFARYCRTPGALWQPCAVADADDAMLALWAQLLYRQAPCGQMPPAWRASAQRALSQLERLRDPRRATYQIGAALPVSLLMDNTEIYAALRQVAVRQRCMGQARAAARTALRAHSLGAAIERLFRPQPHAPYLVSTQENAAHDFYPQQVAQVYPILFGLHQGEPARTAMQAWLDQYGATWLSGAADPYPWGLVALAAQAAGLPEAALRWLAWSAPLRHGSHWNIVEEAAFQSLCLQHRGQALPCRALYAQEKQS